MASGDADRFRIARRRAAEFQQITQINLAAHTGGAKIRPRLANGASIDLFADHDHQRGARKDLDVEGERGVLQIPDVERDLVGGRDVTTAVDLCPARLPRADQGANGRPDRLIAGEKRPGSDKGHVADQNVVNLRQLIDARPPQEASDRVRRRAAYCESPFQETAIFNSSVMLGGHA